MPFTIETLLYPPKQCAMKIYRALIDFIADKHTRQNITHTGVRTLNDDTSPCQQEQPIVYSPSQQEKWKKIIIIIKKLSEYMIVCIQDSNKHPLINIGNVR